MSVPRSRRRQEHPETRERRLSPQERRRQRIINFGVWFLVIAFCMASGIMLFNPNPREREEALKRQQEVTHNPQAEIQRDLEFWKGKVAEDPEDPGSHFNLGYYYYQRAMAAREEARGEDLARAQESLEKALELDPDYLQAHQFLARVKSAQGKAEEAREHVERLLEIARRPVPEGEDPATWKARQENQQAQAYELLARLEIEQKDYPAALEALARLLEIQPGNATGYLLRGHVYQQQGEEEKARKELETAREIAGKTHDLENAILASQMLYAMDHPAPAPDAIPGKVPPPSPQEKTQ